MNFREKLEELKRERTVVDFGRGGWNIYYDGIVTNIEDDFVEFEQRGRVVVILTSEISTIIIKRPKKSKEK